MARKSYLEKNAYSIISFSPERGNKIPPMCDHRINPSILCKSEKPPVSNLSMSMKSNKLERHASPEKRRWYTAEQR